MLHRSGHRDAVVRDDLVNHSEFSFTRKYAVFNRLILRALRLRVNKHLAYAHDSASRLL
jgi:hypothetical protein